MASQARIEGRFLGGRPPYGYQLVDLGPHPNPGKAADGKRLRQLAPDPATAPVVVRIFAEYIRGRGDYAIAEGLTRDAIPCPSAADRARNPHRDGHAWSKGAVRAILSNPRYTGRQVWNRQRKHETLLSPDDVTLGYATTMRWNTPDQWIYSEQRSHPALIDDATFTRAQQLRSRTVRPAPAPGVPRARHPYLLRGALICGICERRMQGNWTHDQAYYRCRYPDEYALANRIHHPRNIYLREAWILPPLDTWVATCFLPHRLDDTIDQLAAATTTDPGPGEAAAQAAHTTLTECDAKLATYRTALESGTEPTIVNEWITEIQARRATAQAQLRHLTGEASTRMSRDEIARLVRTIADVTAVIREADPADKAVIYQQLGLRLTYHPAKQKVLAEIDLDQHPAHNRRLPESVRGGT
ncbi:recombinase family protein [Streptomyces boninensis]|uniref:recombinase family protein n=1 Tax=Streptomyces boninensis TaxID=2039455 RepID=UPI003B214A4A